MKWKFGNVSPSLTKQFSRTAGLLLLGLWATIPLRAQAADIPLVLVPLGSGSSAFYRLGIIVGIGSGAPKTYLFDTGSSVFNAAYSPAWWPSSITPTTAPLATNVTYGYSDGDAFRGNIVSVPSLSFYASSTANAPAYTLPMLTPGYQINAVTTHLICHNVDTTFAADIAAGTPPLQGVFFGTFGAGDFVDTTTTKIPLGGVLGQSTIPGTTAGYVVAANGQQVSTLNGPQGVQSVMKPSVILGLTPSVLAQFTTIVPWSGKIAVTFPNSGANSSTEFGADFNYSLNAAGQATVSWSGRTLLDSGTQDMNLYTTQNVSAYETENPPNVNPGTKLTVAGAVTGAASSSEIALAETTGGLTYSIKVHAPNDNSSTETAGIPFFLQNSVLFDLNGQAIGYTSNFVTDAPIVTPLTASSASVPLGLAGVISGTGGLSITSGGSATLSAANTYTGPTVVAAGGKLYLAGPGSITASPLSVDGMFDISMTSSGAAIPSLSGTGVIDLGSQTLTIVHTNGTFSGVIADGGLSGKVGGSLLLAGGTQALTGVNTYSGGTHLDGGILAVNNDAALGTGPLSFDGGALRALAAGPGIISRKAISLNAGGGTFLADAGTASTLNGAITGAGSLTKDGPGALTLTGTNMYEGGTILSAGTLTVNGVQALGLGDVTVNGGTLNADPQPINAKRNYTQNPGGTLQLQVAGANPGQYDSLNVGGNATLSGTLQLISLGFQPKAGNQLTLVTTGGVVSGRFAQFVDPFVTGPGFSIVDLAYGPNSVLLKFLNFASFALTPNELAAANLLDPVHLDPRAVNLISFLDQEPFANLPGDLDRISPDGLTAFYEIGFSNANIQRLNLESRLDDLHNGSNGFSSNMKVNGATVNLEDRADADGKSSKAVVEPILQPGPQNRWGVWVTGFGDFVNVDGDGNGQGYNFTTGGVSLGLDYRITDQLAIGVMGEYSHTWTELNPGGHIDVDSGRGGVYATWFSHGIYINGAIYGGHNNYDSGRAGLGGLATGSTEGSEWSTFIGGGYDFHFAHLTAGPIASLQYTDVGIDGFGEKGSLAPLDIHSGSAESLRSDVGFRAFYQWQIGKVVVEPSLKAAWEHEYKYSALPITAGFAGVPGPSATFSGPSEGHDSAVVSAGVSVQLTPAIVTYVNYDGQLGRGNYDSNAVTGGVGISF